MSFAFLPLYTGDYRRDTAHLSPMKHGIYLLLLMHCWDTKGPLPLDEQEMAGIANCRSADEVEALRYVISRFFVRMEDGHYNERMQREIERAHAISVDRSDAGRRGANERMRRFREAQALAKQAASKSQASDATPTPTLTPTTTPTKSTTLSGVPPDAPPPTESKAQATTRQLRAEAVAILQFLNAKTGRAYQPVPANIDPIVARLRDGATPVQCRQVTAKKAREWRGDERMDQYIRPKTLFNRTNFANYVGELVAVPEDQDG